MKKLLLSPFAISLLVCSFGLASKARAQGVTSSTAPVQYMADGSVVPGAVARLDRNEQGITVNVHTSGLRQGTYSLWWFVYNNPQFCLTTPCADDPISNVFDVPAVQGSILNASGHVVGKSGIGNFSAKLSIGGPYSGEILFGPGLLYPRDAEIFLVLRYHGPVQPPMVPEQLSTFFGGGCGFDENDNPTGPCEDVQFVAFP